MIIWARNIFAYCVSAVAAAASARYIQSTVVADVIIPNLVAIVVALLAINVQTTVVIAVRLKDLSDRKGFDFKSSINQFRIAILEQAALVVLSLALSAIVKSTIKFAHPIIDVSAFFILFAALHIFLDTTNGILVALFPDD